MSESSVPWRRVIAEGTAIVVSILLAFGIQAWWEQRGEHDRERIALEALATDFAAADSILRLRELAIDSAAVAAQEILAMVGPAADPADPDSLARLVPRLLRRPTFEPPMGALQALLGSGELRLIRNQALRAELASFPSAIETLATTQDFGTQVVFGMLLPYLNSRVPMLEYGLMATGDSDFPVDRSALLRSLEFENLVQNRLMGIRFSQASVARVSDRIDVIRRMLDEEIAG